MKLLISILVFILMLAITFYFGAFVSWDLDLSNWQPEDRFLLAALGSIFAGVGALVTWEVME